MKKSLCAALLCALALLAGCGGKPEPNAMRLEPVALSENERELLDLAGVDLNAFVLYDYHADDSLRSIQFSRYLLNDKLEWEPDTAYQVAVFDENALAPQGRIALIEEEGRSFGLNVRAGGASYSTPAPDLPADLPDAAAHGVGKQEDGADIVYGQEIPLLIRTLRADSSMYVLSASGFGDAASLKRFEGDLFTEAFTVTFSDTAPD